MKRECHLRTSHYVEYRKRHTTNSVGHKEIGSLFAKANSSKENISLKQEETKHLIQALRIKTQQESYRKNSSVPRVRVYTSSQAQKESSKDHSIILPRISLLSRRPPIQCAPSTTKNPKLRKVLALYDKVINMEKSEDLDKEVKLPLEGLNNVFRVRHEQENNRNPWRANKKLQRVTIKRLNHRYRSDNDKNPSITPKEFLARLNKAMNFYFSLDNH